MKRLRIGTWNVEFAKPDRLQTLERVIAEHKADIWVLTETHDDLAPHGMRAAHSEARPAAHKEVRPGSRWVSIWSPISFEVVETKDPLRTVIALFELGPEQKLMVYGTVMPWHSDQGDLPHGQPVANWSEHHRVTVEQSSEWASLQSRFPDAKLCVAGDYNTDMATGAFYGTKQGIASILLGLARREMFCATGPGRIPRDLLPALPIDHIALPLEWAPRTSVVAAWPAVKGVISDHSGLVVEIDFR